jgi:hypothetical protein
MALCRLARVPASVPAGTGQSLGSWVNSGGIAGPRGFGVAGPGFNQLAAGVGRTFCAASGAGVAAPCANEFTVRVNGTATRSKAKTVTATRTRVRTGATILNRILSSAGRTRRLRSVTPLMAPTLTDERPAWLITYSRCHPIVRTTRVRDGERTSTLRVLALTGRVSAPSLLKSE